MSIDQMSSLDDHGLDAPRRDPCAAGAAPPADSPGDDPINILIVDDEPRNLTVLESVLDGQGYRLVRAESAEQALLALVMEEFALLVVDIHMPGMSGFELAGMIKQRKKTEGIPIIFLTAYYSEDRHVIEGYNTGAVDYLHKPINPSILRCKVAVFAELYRQGRESARANRLLLREVSARRHAEEQLRQLNDDLERRVAERTDELVQVNTALSESERRLRLALKASRTEVWTWELATDRFTWSDESETLRTFRLGASAGKLERFRQLVHEDDRGRVFEALQDAISRGAPYQCEFRMVRPDGEVRWVTNLGVVQYDEARQPAAMIGTITDVTDRKRAEEALRQADRRKDQFLATLAHELRGPLAPLRTGLHVLGNSPEPAVSARIRDMMERQLSHMVRLIDDLLDVSRITSDKFTLQKQCVSLQEVTETAVEASRPLIEASGHHLTIASPEEPVWLVADPTRLAQLISNLLTNAAKYTPEAGRIGLASSTEGGDVVIRVSDTGLGIPPAMLDRVFEMFTQVNRTLDRAQGGLGVGLALVKRVVELHGGTIAAESPGVGMGTTFTVRIPLVEVPPSLREPPSMPGPVSAGHSTACRRVLVVDDNVDSAQTLTTLLQLSGHETRTAHDGPDALEVAHSFRPEVVFLDIGLPRMDGYEVARRLRADGSLGGVVLVALTGWGSEEDKRKSREAGFDFHLTKPVEHTALVRIIDGVRASGREPPSPEPAAAEV
ncbi:MAG: response regulator [Isosphaeraceae bacterium]